MATMKAMQVAEAGGDFELVELEVPEPGSDDVRIRVEACGICHSDVFTKEGMFPGIEYPRVPGHEVIGVIDAVGSDVDTWEEGDRVGVGWHGGHCFTCDACRDGEFVLCENQQVTGLHFDGGYAEYTVAPAAALARVPDALSPEDAAPLMCAGITVYNALRNTGARPGDRVAIQGIGGLGHLAIQYARKFGFETVAVSGSPDKEALARELGAHHFVDASSTDAAEWLTERGGARVIVATAPNSEIVSAIAGGLGRDGELMIVAAAGEPVSISPLHLISGNRSVRGWASGDALDSEQTLEFSALTGVRPSIETFALEDANEAFAKMMDNDVRFRAVLKP